MSDFENDDRKLCDIARASKDLAEIAVDLVSRGSGSTPTSGQLFDILRSLAAIAQHIPLDATPTMNHALNHMVVEIMLQCSASLRAGRDLEEIRLGMRKPE